MKKILITFLVTLFYSVPLHTAAVRTAISKPGFLQNLKQSFKNWEKGVKETSAKNRTFDNAAELEMKARYKALENPNLSWKEKIKDFVKNPEHGLLKSQDSLHTHLHGPQPTISSEPFTPITTKTKVGWLTGLGVTGLLGDWVVVEHNKHEFEKRKEAINQEYKKGGLFSDLSNQQRYNKILVEAQRARGELNDEQVKKAKWLINKGITPQQFNTNPEKYIPSK